MPDVDSTNGIYRRIYSGFLASDRFNQVSEVCESWFWRLHALVDDYGNIRVVSWKALSVAASPVRDVPDAEAERRTRELVNAGLLKFYTVRGHTFINVVDFLRFQPAGKNGKRLKRFPTPDDGVFGESGGIRVNPVYPDESSLSKAIQGAESSLSSAIQCTSTFPCTSTPTPTFSDNQTPANAGTIPGLALEGVDQPDTTSPPAKRVRRDPMADASPQFRKFWVNYPKVRRDDAYGCKTLWNKLKLDDEIEEVMAGLMRYKSSAKWTKDEGQYTDTPHKWLNRRMWVNHPEQAPIPGAPY